MPNFVPSKYTAVIHNLREQGFDFGLKDYPIFDESYREILNNKLLDHFDFYEIGQETPALFKLFLNRTMNEIMPYYNELYKSRLEYSENLLKNVDFSEVFEGNANSEVAGTGNSNSTSLSKNKTTGESESKNIFNSTPQGQILLNSIAEQNYATNLTQIGDNSTSNSENNITDSTDSTTSQKGKQSNAYNKKISGNNGNYLISDIILGFRKAIVNIDYMIFEDERIKDLFFGLN